MFLDKTQERGLIFMGNEAAVKNPLGSAPVGSLMVKFATPSIVAMLVSALYNIVDQLFIGHSVGALGNAATNVAFPMTTSCIALALMFGIGGASCFNLSMGRGEKEKAGYYIGNAASMLFICGLVLCLIARIFLVPILKGCGSPDDVLPYAKTYVGITALGFPFLITTAGGAHLVRADGSPTWAMLLNLSGAVINTILDAIFIFGFGMGMAGAALATITGQIFSAILVFRYLRQYKTVPLRREHFIPGLKVIARIASIGAASFFNQIAMMVLQIVLNNSLTFYGAQSAYGASIPLAAAGIAVKVFQVFFSIVIGLAQGSQPIESFNYGAEKYDRVRKAYLYAIAAGVGISVFSFIMFQVFPRQILSLFGEGSKEYFEFGCKFFRIFLFFIWANAIQPITSTFFTSIGKPVKGIFLSLTRQIIFLLPAVLILPRFLGIDGILYAGMLADGLSFVVAVIMAAAEFRDIRRLELNKEKLLKGSVR